MKHRIKLWIFPKNTTGIQNINVKKIGWAFIVNWVVSTLMFKITKKLVYLAFRYNQDGISITLKPST